MWNFFLILACIGAGLALRRARRVPENAGAALSGYAVNVALPALVLVEIRGMPTPDVTSGDFLGPATMAWIVFACAVPFGVALGRWLGWSPETIGAFVLTAGLGNTSFVGYPLIDAIYGRDGLRHAMIADQLGSFLVLSTFGVAVAASFAGADRSWRATLHRLIFFPPLIALVVAFATRGWSWPEGATRALERVGATLVPVALVSVGIQLRLDPAAILRERKKLALGLAYKLAAAPALVLLFNQFVLSAIGATASPVALKTAVLEAAMAPMVTAAILATEFELDAELANLMVGVGIPLSLITVPFWAQLLQ